MTQSTDESKLPPVVKEVQVPLSPEAAFRRFTGEMASWWPLDSHSVGEEEAVGVTFGSAPGEDIVEEIRGGETAVWGTIVEWDPPARVAFTWHPGREPSTAQKVEVSFQASDQGTRVTVTHHDWHVFGVDARKLRGAYDEGWGFVLGRYTSSIPAGA